jgi:hypothetical protein
LLHQCIIRKGQIVTSDDLIGLDEVYFNENLPCFGDLESEDRNATRFFMTSG